ncbi:ZP domain-containing protein [Caerostris extrusa]|uniref:ZP domain-containing protein n=1 Tax=Caerostris extrusa TaxID=172846 RepID=A0AAV4Y8C4_CAEEX|nr:ZP domain-containing protein [Caerostris extrusa]
MESPMFLVTNLKPTLDTDQPGLRWPDHQLQTRDHSEGHIHVKAHHQGLCVNLTTLYILGAIIGAIQVIIVCVCASLFFCRGEHDIRTKTGASTTQSWPPSPAEGNSSAVTRLNRLGNVFFFSLFLLFPQKEEKLTLKVVSSKMSVVLF